MSQKQPILDVPSRTADVRNTHYIWKYCFIYAYEGKKKSILDKRAIFIQFGKKIPNATQYPVNHDLKMSFVKGEFNLVPSKLNYLHCNWEICKINVIYIKVTNFQFISTEIQRTLSLSKQEVSIWFFKASPTYDWITSVAYRACFKWLSLNSIFIVYSNYLIVLDVSNFLMVIKL